MGSSGKEGGSGSEFSTLVMQTIQKLIGDISKMNTDTAKMKAEIEVAKTNTTRIQTLFSMI